MPVRWRRPSGSTPPSAGSWAEPVLDAGPYTEAPISMTRSLSAAPAPDPRASAAAPDVSGPAPCTGDRAGDDLSGQECPADQVRDTLSEPGTVHASGTE